MANQNEMMESLMNLLSQDGAKEKMTELLSGLTGNSGNDASPPAATSGQPELSPEYMNMMLKAKDMMSRLNDTSDNRIALLYAIRPFLSGHRSSGIDRMVKLIQVMNFSAGFKNFDK